MFKGNKNVYIVHFIIYYDLPRDHQFLQMLIIILIHIKSVRTTNYDF